MLTRQQRDTLARYLREYRAGRRAWRRALASRDWEKMDASEHERGIALGQLLGFAGALRGEAYRHVRDTVDRAVHVA